MDGSVLAVLAAHQNNLVTSKMMTSQVVQCLQVENVPKIRLGGKLTKQSKLVYHDKPYSFETDFDWLIRFNGKKRNI